MTIKEIRLVKKLTESINLDLLPDAIDSTEDLEDTLMDLAILCRMKYDSLTESEKNIFDEKNKDIIIKVACELNLLQNN
jgi:hypothetical protein